MQTRAIAPFSFLFFSLENKPGVWVCSGDVLAGGAECRGYQLDCPMSTGVLSGFVFPAIFPHAVMERSYGKQLHTAELVSLILGNSMTSDTRPRIFCMFHSSIGFAIPPAVARFGTISGLLSIEGGEGRMGGVTVSP